MKIKILWYELYVTNEEKKIKVLKVLKHCAEEPVRNDLCKYIIITISGTFKMTSL